MDIAEAENVVVVVVIVREIVDCLPSVMWPTEPTQHHPIKHPGTASRSLPVHFISFLILVRSAQKQCCHFGCRSCAESPGGDLSHLLLPAIARAEEKKKSITKHENNGLGETWWRRNE